MPSDQTVLEGSVVVFNCRAQKKSHKISWMKDGNQLDENYRITFTYYGDLSIKNVRVDDEGFYVCAISDHNSENYAQAELTVNGKY